MRSIIVRMRTIFSQLQDEYYLKPSKTQFLLVEEI